MSNYNTNEIYFSPSSVGRLMTEPKEKSNLAKYNDLVESLEEKENDYLSVVNKATKTAINKFKRIQEIKESIEILRPIKDEVQLSKTAQSYLCEVYVQWRYGRRKNIKNKYISKGLEVEQLSANLLSDVLQRMFRTNEKRFRNDFLIGTPDIIINEKLLKFSEVEGVFVMPTSTELVDVLIIDLKSSFDIFTFFANLPNVKELNTTYYWQLQAYMALTGAKNAQLCYCLVDTPLGILESEKQKLKWEMCATSEQDPDYVRACEELERLHTYSDIEKEDRIILIDIPRNQDDIDLMYKKIVQGRKWIETSFGLDSLNEEEDEDDSLDYNKLNEELNNEYINDCIHGIRNGR